MGPQDMQRELLELANHYQFELPKELIAQEPLPNREDARLMVINRPNSSIDHRHVRDLDELLKAGDCLVLNDTRVIPAQLIGQRVSTGGKWQGLVVENDGQHWKMLAKTRGKVKIGERIRLLDRHGKARFDLVLVARTDSKFWIGKPVAEECDEESLQTASLDELLNAVGRVPLPHYIRGGNMVDSDVKDYQTVYAKHAGAVAAPTAGLHFTESLIKRVIDRGVKIAPVTLHVGIGTFRPLDGEDLNEHQMHSEAGRISETSACTINECKQTGGRVIAVGTTSVRVLESAAQSGEPLKAWQGDTDLFIRPGYKFKIIDSLLTNFHLPKSTLIVLVRTFGGDTLMTEAYEQAVAEEYRFFSYGDAMLIE